MPLSRQLVLIVSGVLALGFLGAFVINVYDTREYLTRQLESHAQDTATSLGVTLSQQFTSDDTVHGESYVDALFDRGYYRQIVVQDLDGEHLIERVIPVRVEGVPGWFVRWLPLTTPRAQAAIQAGWRQAGEVVVISHPGFAYQNLWAAAVKTFWWCLGLFLASAGIVTLAVEARLRPLVDVERQALAISGGEFRQLEPPLRPRELARVVGAMNDMVSRVEAMLGEQREQAERLRGEVYVDPVTGTGNARAFDRDLGKLVHRLEEHAFGAVLCVSVGGLEAANRAGGYGAGDALLQRAAERLRPVLESETSSLARLGGSLFAAVLLDIEREDATRLSETSLEALQGLATEDTDAVAVNAGLAFYNGAQTAEELTANAQAALRNAVHEGPGGSLAFAPAETPDGPELFEEDRWRALLERAIEAVRISLLVQPVRARDMVSVLHEEVLARLRDEEGALVPAGVFIPMASHLGLTAAIDCIVIETVIRHVTGHPGSSRDFALNLAHATVEDPSFCGWLLERLREQPTLGRRLSFEVTAHTARSAPGKVLELARGLRAHGAGFGLDRVGAAELEFDAVRRLAPDYLKVDGAFVHGLDRDPERQAYVRSLVAVGHGLRSRVVAEYVENAAELHTVLRLGFDGAQGHHLGGPRRLNARPAMQMEPQEAVAPTP
jgi:diguanylate cyclase (GGDEF)-like protein